MIRIAAAFAALIVAHLGAKDRRKGSHAQRSHGSWSPNNPLQSKAASKAKAAARGRKMATGGGKKPDRDSEPASYPRTGPVDGTDRAAVDARFKVLEEKAGGDPTKRKWDANETGGAAFNPDEKLPDGQKIRELPRSSRNARLRMAIRGARGGTIDDLRRKDAEARGLFRRHGVSGR